MLDLVIRGGRIVDGTGRAGFSGDVGIAGGTIVEVGRVSTPARRTIDADGLIVTPGFVDIHSHFDGQASWDSELAPSSGNGVTSTVMGNCGVGFAPARPDRHDWLIGLLEAVEDIPGTALAEGLTWEWETYPQYLDALAGRRYAIDVAGQLPHVALRTYVMGERGADSEAHPADDEIAAMRDHARASLAAGAIGFSTSRTAVHRTGDGAVLGTTYAGDRELLAIAETLREAGIGVIQLISDTFDSDDAAYVDREMTLVRDLAARSGRPLSLTVTQGMRDPQGWRAIMARIAEMARDGLAVRAQVAPRGVGALVGLQSSVSPFARTPSFRALAGAPLAELVDKLRRPETKAAILAELATNGIFGFEAYGRMFRMERPVDYEPTPQSSILALARAAGRDPANLAYDALLEEDGRRVLFMPMVNYADGDLDAVHEMLADPNALYGVSDAGAHCGAICDASFPTTTLALWSRGNRHGRRLPLEALVHGYTQRNARHVGWHDRGVLAPGHLADLNVIDLDRLALDPPHVVHDLPAGGRRFLQTARGYAHTIKRGVETFNGGVATGALPGRLVRGPQRAASRAKG